MAHIRKRKLSDGSTAFVVRWTDPAGEQRTRQFSKATGPRPAEAARDFKIRIEDELRRGTYVDPKAGAITFAEYAATYAANLHQRQSSAERLDLLLRVHVNPLIGKMRIGAIRRREVQDMVNALKVKPAGGPGNGPKGPLSPSYVENIYRVVSGIFNAAVLDQVIPTNPCVKVNLPAKTRSEIVIPTPEQVAAVADAITPRYRALVLLAAGTGLRSAELRGLDLDRLRLLERTVRVDRQLITPDRAPHYYGPPKTDASYRTVPISESYIEVVAEHIERFGTGTDGLVFTARSGQPIRRKTINENLGPILRAQGLPPRSGMHVFRHYYVSSLIAAGEDIVTIMRRAGHSTSEETTGTYGHLWPDHEDRTRGATEAAFPMGRQDRARAPRAATGPRREGAQVTTLSSRAR